MRFHIGFSKRLPAKTLIKFGLGIALLLLYFCSSLTAYALEDGFTNRNIGNIKYCSYNTASPNASCTASSSTYQNSTINGVSNAMVPTGIQTSQNGRMTPSAHTNYWIYSGVSASGSNNPCNNPNTLSFNISLLLEDPNNILASNELNPNTYTGPSSPLTASMIGALMSIKKSYSSNASTYYNYTGIGNSIGVSAGFRTGTGTNDYRNDTQCSFLSYSSNKGLNFRCTINATLPSNSLYIRAEYTNTSYVNSPSTYQGLIIRDDIKVTELNDPCNNNYASDSQGIVDSINNSSNQITQGVADIIENQNTNTDILHNDLEDIKDNQETTIDKLNTINSTLQNNHNNLVDSNLNPNLGGGSGAGHYFGQFGSRVEDTPVSSLVLLPVNLLQHLVDTLDESTCSSYNLPFDIVPQNNGSGAGHTLEFPCPNLEEKLGSNLYNTIDIFICIFMFYKIAMMIIKWYEKTTDLKDQFYDLYNEH